MHTAVNPLDLHSAELDPSATDKEVTVLRSSCLDQVGHPS